MNYVEVQANWIRVSRAIYFYLKKKEEKKAFCSDKWQSNAHMCAYFG